MARLNGRGYLGIVGVLAAQRLVEVVWSARNLRHAGPGRRAAPGSFPIMVAVNAALFAVPAITRFRRPAPPGPVQALALTGIAAATGLRLWVICTLGDAWNVPARVPANLVVVTDGPYRWVRHPNYVAVAVEFACVPTLGGAYAQALLLSAANALVLIPRIRGEEALLDAVPGYREAFAGRPRFIPLKVRRGSTPPAPLSRVLEGDGERSAASAGSAKERRRTPARVSVDTRARTAHRDARSPESRWM